MIPSPVPAVESEGGPGQGDDMDPEQQRLALHVRTTAELDALGFTRAGRERLVVEGRLRRLGRSWWGTAQTPHDVAAALSSGHRLTCMSALEHHGLWVPPHHGRHEASLRAGRSTGDRSAQRGAAVAHRYLRSWPDDGPLLPVRYALEHAAHCVDPEDLAILLESAANSGLLPLQEIGALVAGLPGRTRRAIGTVCPWAQSGTETRVRRFVARLGARVAPQPSLLPDEFMDMLVGELLVIECDSRRHHEDPEADANDRRRDQELVRRGYTVLRLTWEDVMLTWDRTQDLLRKIIAAERHRAPRALRGAEGVASRGRAGRMEPTAEVGV